MEREKIKKLESFLDFKLNKDNSRIYEPSNKECYVFVKQKITNGSFFETNEIVCYDLSSNEILAISEMYYSNFKNYIKTRSIFIETIQITNPNFLDKGFENFSLYFLIELASTTFKQNILVLPSCFGASHALHQEKFFLSQGFIQTDRTFEKSYTLEYTISKNSIIQINNIKNITLEYIFYKDIIK